MGRHAGKRPDLHPVCLFGGILPVYERDGDTQQRDWVEPCLGCRDKDSALVVGTLPAEPLGRHTDVLFRPGHHHES